MKRLLSASVAILLLGACHWHSRAWLAQHANDKATRVVADTQPVVRQEGEAKAPPKAEPKLHAWSRASATTPMSASSVGSSDGRTVGIFLMSNDVDLSFAKVALASSTNEDVRNFARRILTDHTQLVLTIRSLIADQDMSPAEDNAARDLRDLSTLQRDSLRALTGRDFDSTYVAMELERHHAILAMIDDVLLPRARNDELREMLASSRPIIAAHVAHAEQLQATLARR
jgi:putative membrane protein